MLRIKEMMSTITFISATNFIGKYLYKVSNKRIMIKGLFTISYSEGRYEEIKHLMIALLSLAFLFSLRFLFRSISFFFEFFIISLIAVGSGFVLHELAHKYTAIHYGHWAAFRLSYQGLAFAFLIAFLTFGNFIFAAPGATVIIPAGAAFGYTLTRRENGIIAAAGPITNLILASFFYVALSFSSLVPSGFEAFYKSLCWYGSFINVWLAAFNLIPFGVLDGRKIIAWNPLIWASLSLPSWAISILFIIGLL